MKTLKRFLPWITLTLLFLLVALLLLLFVGNFSLFPQHLAEDYYNDDVIEAKDHYFYLATDDTGSLINDVKAIKRYAFLWKPVEGRITELWVGEQQAATLFCFEGDDITHCFIQWNATKHELGKDYYAFRTDTVQINGKEVKLDRYSYFTMDLPLAQIAINGHNATFKS